MLRRIQGLLFSRGLLWLPGPSPAAEMPGEPFPLLAVQPVDVIRRTRPVATNPRNCRRFYHPSGGATCQTTLAGLPETTVRSATFIFTTERAATTAPRPTVTPFMIIEPLPIQA